MVRRGRRQNDGQVWWLAGDFRRMAPVLMGTTALWQVHRVSKGTGDAGKHKYAVARRRWNRHMSLVPMAFSVLWSDVVDSKLVSKMGGQAMHQRCRVKQC